MGRLIGTALSLGVMLGGCDLVFPIEAGLPGDDAPGVDGAVRPDAALPLAEDEDQDGVKNEDDRCPGVPDPEQLDFDGDTIGDACDPRPDAAGDTVVFATNFNAGDADLGCEAPAEWTKHDGFLEVASPTLTALDCGPTGLDPTKLSIETGWEILLDSGAVAQVGGAISSDGGWFEAEDGELRIVVDDAGDVTPADFDVLPIRPARLVVQLEVAPNSPTGARLLVRALPITQCADPSDCDKSATTARAPADQIAVFASGAHARLLHMVLYTR